VREPEQFVQRLFAKLYGVELQKLPEPGDQKVPDFELVINGERLAVLEVKNLMRVEPSEKTGWRMSPPVPRELIPPVPKVLIDRPPGFVAWERVDNGPSRVGSVVHEAWKQLRNYPEAKVLVFVNDGDLDVGDLDEAFNGFMEYGDDSVTVTNIASRKIALGDIREEKNKIDLYVWINRHLFVRATVQVFPAGQEPVLKTIEDADRIQFRYTTEKGRQLHQRFFLPAGVSTLAETGGR
jgi:hypothetical protein